MPKWVASTFAAASAPPARLSTLAAPAGKPLHVRRRAAPVSALASRLMADPIARSSPLLAAAIDPRLPDKDGKCPPCFNCLLPAFKCANFGTCSSFSGRCDCPTGFGGDDCSTPLCGSLPDDNSRRPPRQPPAETCSCPDGWSGINCNVCSTDSVCNALMPPGLNGTCYASPIAVQSNHAKCDVTNPKILTLLQGQHPQVSLSCNATGGTPPAPNSQLAFELAQQLQDDPNATPAPLARCGFQFWIAGDESFYCDLDQCVGTISTDNATSYDCRKIRCECMPGRMLCGKDGSVDIRDFLTEEVKGPGKLKCSAPPTDPIGSTPRMCEFTEPAMDDLISQLLGDTSIQLRCSSGECLHVSQIPGYGSSRPQNPDSGSTLVFALLTTACLLIVFCVVMAFLRNHWKASRRRPELANTHALTQAELDKLMADHVPATLAFRDIQYRIPLPRSSTNASSTSSPASAQHPAEYIQILHGIDGLVRPGEMLAIMGGSGAGKSTCLDILARRNKSGEVSGHITVNGRELDPREFRQMCGYVDQEDTLMSTLTVEETILYSALLRLPKDMSYEAKCSRVRDTMVELGILHIAKSRIGDATLRGISGGEKRRVSIACELVTSPSILFLDEPTSGLDSYNAHNVIECLRNLARNYNRTIILTIHQPRSDIFSMFDGLLLLSRGHTVYSGPAQTAVHHFTDIGFQCPLGYNIADYLIDITVGFNAPDRQGDGQPGDEAPPLVIVDPMGSSARPHTPGDAPTTFAAPIPSRPSLEQDSETEVAAHLASGATPLRRPRVTSSNALRSPILQRPQSPASRHLARLASGFLESRAGADLQAALLEASQSLPTSPAPTTPATPARGPTPTAMNAAEVGMGPAALNDGEDSDADAQRPLLGSNSNASEGARRRLSRNTRRDLRAMAAQRAPLGTQFRILADRTFKNLYRNPYLLLTHYAMAVVVAVLCGLLFWRVTADIAGFQNRMGCFFFVCALFGFSCLSSLQTFATERVLFTRERANGYYSPVTYFSAKVLCDLLPLRVVPPILLGCIIYNMVGLIDSYSVFLKFVLVLVLFNVTAAALCLLVSLAIRETPVASLVASLAMLFSMLFGGLLLNKDSIPTALSWLKHLSFFNYALEALVVNELKDLQLTENKYGLQIEVPAAVILSTFGFNAQAYWADVYKLIGMSSGFLVVGFLVLHFKVKERR
ncbi:hypothetical protein BCR44DRAFT_62443 [Catenaria anguillulae PL171]|uniref:ABC transporter domain-containing protein n=1 Tax=Catenaria anguillulae PL171 TaxID=765915 RepID=A0A1Y2HBI3_9FUNG|nr:hypothetical protein BCR44DRAFT_62443 [Catenaria anguillulae PL171]